MGGPPTGATSSNSRKVAFGQILFDTSIVPKPSHANKRNLANVMSGFTERVIHKEPEIGRQE